MSTLINILRSDWKSDTYFSHVYNLIKKTARDFANTFFLSTNKLGYAKLGSNEPGPEEIVDLVKESIVDNPTGTENSLDSGRI